MAATRAQNTVYREQQAKENDMDRLCECTICCEFAGQIPNTIRDNRVCDEKEPCKTGPHIEFQLSLAGARNEKHAEYIAKIKCVQS